MTPTAEPVLGSFDAEGAFEFAVALAEMGTRDAGTPGDERARDFVTDAFAEAGWNTSLDEVALPQGGVTHNVQAVQGVADLDGPHIVVGGHIDTRGGSPGANDNASGIGVLVELARELADERPEVPVVLVAFGAEEYQPSEPREHHIGSQAYVDRRGEHVLGAFVVDMVGNGPVTCLCWFDAGPRTMVDRMAAVAENEGLTGYRTEARGDISDHGPFARAGIPAGFLWTFDDGVLHTPNDTPDRLSAEDMRRAGDLALAFVRTLGADDLGGLRPAP